MRVRYFDDTDTAYVEFSNHPAAETKEVNDNILLDLDSNGNLVGMTIEHASVQADISEMSFQQMKRKAA